MGYFPLFVPLDGRRVLLIGGGKTALGKAGRLEPFGAAVHVIAPHILPELMKLPHVTAEYRTFEPEDLKRDWTFVIAATDSRETNHCISLLCRERGIPVNVVDTPADCSFLFPALVRRGPLSIGISTGGASPVGARRIKEDIDRILPENLGEILSWLSEQRLLIQKCVAAEDRRRAVFESLYARCILLGRPLTDPELEGLLEEILRDGIT